MYEFSLDDLVAISEEERIIMEEKEKFSTYEESLPLLKTWKYKYSNKDERKSKLPSSYQYRR